MLLLGSIRSIMRGCIKIDNVFFSKTYPSFLTLKEGSTFLTKPLFNSLYAPFGSPSSGGQKPSGTKGCNRPTVLNFLPLRLSCKESSTSNQAFLLRRKDVTALRCSEPLRFMVGGASKPCAMVLRDGTAGRQLADGTAGGEVYNLQFIINSLLFRVNSL